MSSFNLWREGVPMSLRLNPLTRGIADGVSEVRIMVEIIQNGRAIAAPIPYQITMKTTLGKLNVNQRLFPKDATRIYFLLTSSVSGKAVVSAQWGGGADSIDYVVFFDQPRYARATPQRHRAPPAEDKSTAGDHIYPSGKNVNSKLETSTIIVSFQPNTKLVRGIYIKDVAQPEVNFQTFNEVNGQFTLTHIPNGTYRVTPLSKLEGGKMNKDGIKVTFQPSQKTLTCSGNQIYRLTFKKFEVKTV